MHAFEFETRLHDGILQIPRSYHHWEGKRVKVIVLEEESRLATSESAIGVFQLLASLSDDFMAEGRQQPPMQEREPPSTTP